MFLRPVFVFFLFSPSVRLTQTHHISCSDFLCVSPSVMNEVFASLTARSTDDLQCCKRLGTAVQAQGMFDMDSWTLQRSVCLRH